MRTLPNGGASPRTLRGRGASLWAKAALRLQRHDLRDRLREGGRIASGRGRGAEGAEVQRILLPRDGARPRAEGGGGRHRHGDRLRRRSRARLLEMPRRHRGRAARHDAHQLRDVLRVHADRSLLHARGALHLHVVLPPRDRRRAPGPDDPREAAIAASGGRRVRRDGEEDRDRVLELPARRGRQPRRLRHRLARLRLHLPRTGHEARRRRRRPAQGRAHADAEGRHLLGRRRRGRGLGHLRRRAPDGPCALGLLLPARALHGQGGEVYARRTGGHWPCVAACVLRAHGRRAGVRRTSARMGSRRLDGRSRHSVRR